MHDVAFVFFYMKHHKHDHIHDHHHHNFIMDDANLVGNTSSPVSVSLAWTGEGQWLLNMGAFESKASTTLRLGIVTVRHRLRLIDKFNHSPSQIARDSQVLRSVSLQTFLKDTFVVDKDLCHDSPIKISGLLPHSTPRFPLAYSPPSRALRYPTAYLLVLRPFPVKEENVILKLGHLTLEPLFLLNATRSIQHKPVSNCGVDFRGHRHPFYRFANENQITKRSQHGR